MSVIAYVDDEPMLCRLFELRLRVPGFRIEAYSDPLVALEALQQAPPALVITDYRMPHLTGLDLMVRLPDVPFVVVTGGGFIDDPRIDDPRVRAIVDKPVSFSELLGLVQEVLAS